MRLFCQLKLKVGFLYLHPAVAFFYWYNKRDSKITDDLNENPRGIWRGHVKLYGRDAYSRWILEYWETHRFRTHFRFYSALLTSILIGTILVNRLYHIFGLELWTLNLNTARGVTTCLFVLNQSVQDAQFGVWLSSGSVCPANRIQWV